MELQRIGHNWPTFTFTFKEDRNSKEGEISAPRCSKGIQGEPWRMRKLGAQRWWRKYGQWQGCCPRSNEIGLPLSLFWPNASGLLSRGISWILYLWCFPSQPRHHGPPVHSTIHASNTWGSDGGPIPFFAPILVTWGLWEKSPTVMSMVPPLQGTPLWTLSSSPLHTHRNAESKVQPVGTLLACPRGSLTLSSSPALTAT